MPRKRILVKSIDTSISYQVIGIDLAKHLVSACLITGAGEIFGIDRLTYDDLLKSAERMSPTLFLHGAVPGSALSGRETTRLRSSYKSDRRSCC